MSQSRPCGGYGKGLAETYRRVGSSPVHNLLRADIALDTMRVTAAQDIFEAINRNVEVLGEEIFQIRANSERPVTNRQAPLQYAAAHTAFTSTSIQQFPSEILSEIFIHALPEFPFSYSDSVAPLLFERVCRRWKDIARSTPQLWSSISLDLRNGHDSHHLAIASACLSRSGNYPLSISLIIRDWTLWSLLHTFLQPPHPAVALLATQCERWHTLFVTSPAKGLGEFLAVKNRLPSLRVLSLSIQGSNGGPLAPSTLEAFASAPALQELQTHYLDINNIQPLPLPWIDLTKLTLNVRKATEIWDMLSKCPSLIEFTGEVHIHSPHMAADVPEIKLAHLRFMSLVIPMSSDILSTLTLPALDHLTLDLRNQSKSVAATSLGDPWHVRSGFATLLSQSKINYTLSTLEIQTENTQTHLICLQEHDLVGCLAAVPGLRTLDVSGSHTLSAMLPQVLRVTHDQHDDPSLATTAVKLLLPKLMTLRMSTASRDFQGAQFNEFLKSRRRDVSSGQVELLQRIALTTSAENLKRAATVRMMNTLRVFKGEGMDVTVNIGCEIQPLNSCSGICTGDVLTVAME